MFRERRGVCSRGAHAWRRDESKSKNGSRTDTERENKRGEKREDHSRCCAAAWGEPCAEWIPSWMPTSEYPSRVWERERCDPELCPAVWAVPGQGGEADGWCISSWVVDAPPISVWVLLLPSDDCEE